MKTVVVAFGGNAITRVSESGTHAEQWVSEAEPHFAEDQRPGVSTGPKVTAAIRFLRAGGSARIITTPRRAGEALTDRHETRVVAERVRRAQAGR